MTPDEHGGAGVDHDAAPPRIGITAGDPAGIGPEIVGRALAELGSGGLPAGASVRVYAEPGLFTRSCAMVGLDAGALPAELVPVACGPVPADFAPGHPSAFTGSVAAASVRAAAEAALAGELDAVVTAPLAKSALRAAGVCHPGHTELLAELAGGCPVAMMFVARSLRLTLATIHVPLAEVSARLTESGLGEKIRLTREVLIERERIADPRIALLGLNPHAGEGGLFGEEDERVVRPAAEDAASKGWRVEGPFPADSFFLRHGAEFDAVIAMYHDQGLIPVKLLSEGRAVNVTLGLPFLRTSVDHGTAFDIAGRGLASPDSLLAAIRLAVRWSERSV